MSWNQKFSQIKRSNPQNEWQNIQSPNESAIHAPEILIAKLVDGFNDVMTSGELPRELRQNTFPNAAKKKMFKSSLILSAHCKHTIIFQGIYIHDSMTGKSTTGIHQWQHTNAVGSLVLTRPKLWTEYSGQHCGVPYPNNIFQIIWFGLYIQNFYWNLSPRLFLQYSGIMAKTCWRVAVGDLGLDLRYGGRSLFKISNLHTTY